jgi:glycosyltransferase involved in cell wall biosynthesis
MSKSQEYAFIIPSYNPDENLLKVVQSLRESTDEFIFVIDDGSKEETKHIFETLKKLQDPKLILLAHAINLGKGAALKTVFNHILVNYPNIIGVITLDSDGQHSPKDCIAIKEALKKEPKAFVLGYRTFSKDIPLKSYIGNNISKFVYKVILGYDFKDTQTGLRGLSRDFMRECLKITSNRFEFETEQLAYAARSLQIIEIPIETIYIQNNKSSSFRPLIDSFKIYFVLLRYSLSSIITAIVDFIVFMLSLSFGSGVFMANILARTVSIGVQFKLLDNYVFHTKSTLLNFILFALYVYIMGIVSIVLQINAVSHLGLSVITAKVLIEGFLFFVNFAVLRLYLFTKNSL